MGDDDGPGRRADRCRRSGFGTPSRRSEAVAGDLARAGVPVDELTAGGQLVFASARDQYVGGSRFDPVRRLDDYASALRATVADGCRGFRVAAELDAIHSDRSATC